LTLYLSEIFYSVQGEGELAGVPSVFVRTSGCNLRCSWCDSAYTSWEPEGDTHEVKEVVEAVSEYDADHVVVTGGEPLLQPDFDELCAALDEHTTVETNATVYRDSDADLVSMSPKLSNSTPEGAGAWGEIHEGKRLNFEVIESYIDSHDYQIKFVVADREDIDEIEEVLASLSDYDRERVLLMPEGVDRDVLRDRGEWLAEECKERGFRYSPRLQIHIYGNKRGT
jgi:7-carboxy-7-deazaguanine synthase